MRIFENVNNEWVQIGQNIYGENSGDNCGWTGGISLSSDGATVALGSKEYGSNLVGSGSVRVFQNLDGEWVQPGERIVGEGANDNSGISVSLSGDGTLLAIGAYENDNGDNAGHVRVYEMGTTGVSEIMFAHARVYPNPTTKNIRIDLNKTIQRVTVNVFNAQGVKLQSEELGTVYSFNYILPESNGLYFVQLVNDGGETKTMRVVKSE